VDGTVIQAWAGHKSFKKKEGTDPAAPSDDDPSNPTIDFRGEKRRNDTHQSTTDPESRLYRKGGKESHLSYLGHVLMENRNGLVVDDPNIRDHPNGRCTLVPTLRSQVKYKGTLQPDGSVDMDPRWADQKVAGAKAKESAGKTTEAQRDPLSGKSNPAAPSVANPAQSVKGAKATPVTDSVWPRSVAWA
jgi:hypothetical protein